MVVAFEAADLTFKGRGASALCITGAGVSLRVTIAASEEQLSFRDVYLVRRRLLKPDGSLMCARAAIWPSLPGGASAKPACTKFGNGQWCPNFQAQTVQLWCSSQERWISVENGLAGG